MQENELQKFLDDLPEEDTERLISQARRAALAGDVTAAYALGKLLEGNDDRHAAYWYARAADADDPSLAASAAFNVGQLLSRASNAPAGDLTIARSFYTKSILVGQQDDLSERAVARLVATGKGEANAILANVRRAANDALQKDNKPRAAALHLALAVLQVHWGQPADARETLATTDKLFEALEDEDGRRKARMLSLHALLEDDPAAANAVVSHAGDGGCHCFRQAER